MGVAAIIALFANGCAADATLTHDSQSVAHAARELQMYAQYVGFQSLALAFGEKFAPLDVKDSGPRGEFSRALIALFADALATPDTIRPDTSVATSAMAIEDVGKAAVHRTFRVSPANHKGAIAQRDGFTPFGGGNALDVIDHILRESFNRYFQAGKTPLTLTFYDEAGLPLGPNLIFSNASQVPVGESEMLRRFVTERARQFALLSGFIIAQSPGPVHVRLSGERDVDGDATRSHVTLHYRVDPTSPWVPIPATDRARQEYIAAIYNDLKANSFHLNEQFEHSVGVGPEIGALASGTDAKARAIDAILNAIVVKSRGQIEELVRLCMRLFLEETTFRNVSSIQIRGKTPFAVANKAARLALGDSTHEVSTFEEDIRLLLAQYDLNQLRQIRGLIEVAPVSDPVYNDLAGIRLVAVPRVGTVDSRVATYSWLVNWLNENPRVGFLPLRSNNESGLHTKPSGFEAYKAGIEIPGGDGPSAYINAQFVKEVHAPWSDWQHALIYKGPYHDNPDVDRYALDLKKWIDSKMLASGALSVPPLPKELLENPRMLFHRYLKRILPEIDESGPSRLTLARHSHVLQEIYFILKHQYEDAINP